MKSVESIVFEDFFNLSDLQRLQDMTADAWGVAALITRPDGTPITQPGNFTYFCSEFIRKTEKGARNCQISDAKIGRHNPSGPTIQRCLSAGLWGAGASITVGGRHIGNWLIGQVRNEAQSEEEMLGYARVIGANEAEFLEAYRKVPTMPQERFNKIAHALFLLANQLATIAYQNIQQARSIAERKKAEEALERHRKMLQSIINKSHTHLVYLDPDFNFVAVNSTYAETCHHSPEELIGNNHFLFFPHEENQAIFENVRKTGTSVSFHDKPFTFPDQPQRGTTYWDWTLSPVKDDSNCIEGLVFSLVETTERKLAEMALLESQARLHLALRSAKMGTWYWDLSERRCGFDEQACLLLGIETNRSELDEDELYDLVHPEDRERVRLALVQTFEQNLPYHVEYRLIRPEGDIQHISSRGSLVRNDQGRPMRLNSIVWDVTEQKRAEEERKQLENRLYQARKAESLGQMAAAIAHNFNNLFGVMMGRLELALNDLPQGSKPWTNITAASTALGRAATTSRLMLAYLGLSIGKTEPVELMEFCRKILPLLTSSLPETVHLKLEFSEEKAVVLADSVQITEVLKHLLVNAGEAMGERGGDVALTIHTMPASDVSATRFYPPEWGPNDEEYVCLSVRDSGVGMDSETIEKAFDPFFSTKFTGRGLGLPVVLGIVKAHRGALTVESEPEHGAVFRVFLPLSSEEPRQRGLEQELIDTVSPRDRGTVLLVDDEPMLRSLAPIVLEQMGYEVITAADGVEALEVFRERQEQIRCVILDLMMPRMDGWETLAALRAIRPKLPVILSSGYDEARVMRSNHSERPQAFLSKPYKIKDLEKALDTVLKRSSGSGKDDSPSLNG